MLMLLHKAKFIQNELYMLFNVYELDPTMETKERVYKYLTSRNGKPLSFQFHLTTLLNCTNRIGTRSDQRVILKFRETGTHISKLSSSFAIKRRVHYFRYTIVLNKCTLTDIYSNLFLLL